MDLPGPAAVPPLAEVLASLRVVALPMRVRFRGVTVREAALIEGPAGWGEFAPFPEYGDDEAAWWLASALECAWLGPPDPVRTQVPVNATVPAVGPDRVPALLDRFPGAQTVKVKVAEPGQDLADDLARVAAVRARVPRVRVDANGAWTVDEAVRALSALAAQGPLEYAEQPCRTVAELAAVRRAVPHVPIAADESIRRAEDPLAVARAQAADVAVVKVAPLGGPRRLLALAERLPMPIVVSSALDTVVGVGAGLATAAALPTLAHACGLGTGGFFAADVGPAHPIAGGAIPARLGRVDPEAVGRLAADPDRTRWWRERIVRCHEVLKSLPTA